MELTPGEKLIIHMLADLSAAQNVQGEIDAQFVSKAVAYNHSWAIDWEYGGLIGGEEDPPETVKDVVNYLDMWSFLERGFKNLSTAEQAELATAAPYWGKAVEFPGFDANASGGHYGICRFFIEDMGRWQEFKGRDLNSHSPVVDDYAAMYSVFNRFRRSIVDRSMTLEEMTAILSAP